MGLLESPRGEIHRSPGASRSSVRGSSRRGSASGAARISAAGSGASIHFLNIFPRKSGTPCRWEVMRAALINCGCPGKTSFFYSPRTHLFSPACALSGHLCASMASQRCLRTSIRIRWRVHPSASHSILHLSGSTDLERQRRT